VSSHPLQLHRPPSDSPTPPAISSPLLLTAREAARALAISERTLWGLTAPRGPIRPVRVGRAIRYAPAELQRWIDSQQGG
jgi:predicted DNA-binding transcriptional regulator AlpA